LRRCTKSLPAVFGLRIAAPAISSRVMKSKRWLVSFLLVWALLTLCVSYFAPKIRYLAELEPPARYNHPYDGPVDERVMSVSEARTLCNSLDAFPTGVVCSWVADGTCPSARFYLPSARNCPLQWLASKSPPR
jgi:hypothetical protein